ncbi:MAG: hypothetical protein ACRDIB_07345, partial [Ardenticatenaceae bacterium]
WTEFARAVRDRRIVQPDQQKWDYRHQVLDQPHLKPWQLFAAVKWLELCFHLRPRKLLKPLFAPDVFRRQQHLWSLWHTGLVWLAEVAEFLLATSFIAAPHRQKGDPGFENTRAKASG